MRSTLIVHYSLTGVSRRVAELLSAQAGWPVGEIIEDPPRLSNGWGYLRCVIDSVLRRRPPVLYRGPEPADFETVVLVAPVWVGQLASPMRSFVAGNKDHLQRIAVIMTMGQRGGSRAVAEIGDIAGRDPILAEVVTAREAEDGSCAPALEAFARAVRQWGQGEPVRAATWSPVT